MSITSQHEPSQTQGYGILLQSDNFVIHHNVTDDISYADNVNKQTNVKVFSNNNDDEKADINTKEKENLRHIEDYQKYQQTEQDDQPWASDRDIRILDSNKVPNPNPIVETGGCPECGNTQAFWWIVQTDSGDEPSSQFFRCTKCNHTWRTSKSSL